MLQGFPNNTPIKSGNERWQGLMAQERDNEAALVEQQFRAAWKDATVKLHIEDL